LVGSPMSGRRKNSLAKMRHTSLRRLTSNELGSWPREIFLNLPGLSSTGERFFAEARGPFGVQKCPADFGGANFSAPPGQPECLSLPDLSSFTAPSWREGSCEKIERRTAKASFVARGRGNFLPSKPGGRYMAVKDCPGFRRATPATWGNSYKSNRRILRASVNLTPSGPRRNRCLFWRQEISPTPGIPPAWGD